MWLQEKREWIALWLAEITARHLPTLEKAGRTGAVADGICCAPEDRWLLWARQGTQAGAAHRLLRKSTTKRDAEDTEDTAIELQLLLGKFNVCTAAERLLLLLCLWPLWAFGERSQEARRDCGWYCSTERLQLILFEWVCGWSYSSERLWLILLNWETATILEPWGEDRLELMWVSAQEGDLSLVFMWLPET